MSTTKSDLTGKTEDKKIISAPLWYEDDLFRSVRSDRIFALGDIFDPLVFYIMLIHPRYLDELIER